jgi:activating signal cointegrator complex subunit 3
VKANPSYYGATSSDAEAVEDFLLSVAKETLGLLDQEQCIAIDGDMETIDADVRSSVLGAAGSEYYLTYRSPKQMQFGLQECAKMLAAEIKQNTKGGNERPASLKSRPLERTKRADEISIAWLLYTVACTHEFDELPVRHNEEILNQELSKSLTWGPDTSRVLSPNGRSPYIDPEIYAQPHTK